MRLFGWVVVLGLIAAGGTWVLARPNPLDPADVAGLTGDAAKGEMVFWAAGCASCHMAAGAKGEAQLVLSGGQRFPSPFGTFVAPNISQDPQAGIGNWSLLNLASALKRGVSPEEQHYFPALPYASYAKMELQDVADLHAYLQTLPADATPSQPHELSFPFSRREAVGLWKLLYLSDDWAVPGNMTPTATRGRYVAEALAHCAECHTPRTRLGGLDTSRWLQGAANPSGQGRIPDITPATLQWTEADIVAYLTTGFTPDFDVVGGKMAHVVENLSRLPEADRQAIARYLLELPPGG
ncbi:MAG: diacylglycerol kinase [Rhodobacterales bacterium 32-66-7]|nr:MAG: diacylglycerol kinase [Rhodobacterales bacterium 12-65-15]OYX26371.1 MAG: diacylglycerol kinase [Rhodobacterales bacterium 32-66-7]